MNDAERAKAKDAYYQYTESIEVAAVINVEFDAIFSQLVTEKLPAEQIASLVNPALDRMGRSFFLAGYNAALRSISNEQ